MAAGCQGDCVVDLGLGCNIACFGEMAPWKTTGCFNTQCGELVDADNSCRRLIMG